MRSFYIVLSVIVIISVVVGLYSGYLMALSKEPIVKEIDIPETAIRKIVNQSQHEHYRVGSISYLSTGPTFSQFVYGYEPGPESYGPGGPSCLAFAYDGKPGIVELYIPKYLIVEFPVINEVFHDGPFFLDEPIPFQIKREDSSYVIIRIETSSKYNVVTVSGDEEGSVSPFLRYLLGWGFTFSGSIFFLSLILYIIIKNRLGYLQKRNR